MTQDKQNKRPNVPPLRFSEFTEPWETAKLGAIAEFSKGTGISKEQRSETGLPCILYGELYTTYTNEVIEDVVSKTDLDPTDLVKSQKNDVIIPSSGETAEDIATARCVTSDNVLLGGDLNIIRLVEPNDGRFMSYQLNGIRKYDIAKIAQGVSVVHLYGGDLKMLSVTFPQSPEQKKIADCISLLDRRISVQIGLINKLESLIGGIGQRVFLQFNSFVKLGNVAKITNGNSDVQDAIEIYESGLYPFYDRSDVIKYLNTYYLDKEAIIYAGEGSEFFPRYHNGKFALHQRCYAIFDFKEEYLTKFIYYYMFTLNGYFVRNSVGSTVPSLRMGTFEKVNIPKVPVKQQLYVIKVFDCLHKKLNQAKQTKRLFEMQKQYLLQQMFI